MDQIENPIGRVHLTRNLEMSRNGTGTISDASQKVRNIFVVLVQTVNRDSGSIHRIQGIETDGTIAVVGGWGSEEHVVVCELEAFGTN